MNKSSPNTKQAIDALVDLMDEITEQSIDSDSDPGPPVLIPQNEIFYENRNILEDLSPPHLDLEVNLETYLEKPVFKNLSHEQTIGELMDLMDEITEKSIDADPGPPVLLLQDEISYKNMNTSENLPLPNLDLGVKLEKDLEKPVSKNLCVSPEVSPIKEKLVPTKTIPLKDLNISIEKEEIQAKKLVVKLTRISEKQMDRLLKSIAEAEKVKKTEEGEMPSAEVCPIPQMSAPLPSNEQTYNIGMSSNDVEGLVLEIKENLRLSSGPPSMKAIPCSHLSRKSSRASPYRLPGKYFCDSCEPTCVRHKNKQPDLSQQDPYELLQALLRSENLINEAVRRVKTGFSTKKFYYESDEESSRSSIFRLDN